MGLHQLNIPTDVAIDDEGNTYVLDRDNHRVVKWSPNGSSGELIAGSGEGSCTNNDLSSPLGVFLDEHQNLWVSNTECNTILKYTKKAQNK